MNVEHASRTTKAFVPTSKVDSPNTVLTQHRGTHDAGLDRHVEVCLLQSADWVLGQDACQGHKLSVPGAIEGAVRLDHTTTQDLAVPDEDTSDGCLVALEC